MFDFWKCIWLKVIFFFLDINECEGSYNCECMCDNCIGFYICKCLFGFELNVDNVMCKGREIFCDIELFVKEV